MKYFQTQSTEITCRQRPAPHPFFWYTLEFSAQLTVCCGRVGKVTEVSSQEESALSRDCHVTKAVSHLVYEYPAHISIPGNSKFRTVVLSLYKDILKGCLLEQAALDIHCWVKK